MKYPRDIFVFNAQINPLIWNKYLFILIVAVILNNLFFIVKAQNPINIDGVDLYMYPTNSHNPGPVAGELTDSVTINGTSKYYIMPDPIVNPSFHYAIDPFANVTSSFAWTVTPAISTLGAVSVPAHPAALHYRQINWTSIGTGNILVTETSIAGCGGSTDTTPVAVIAAPHVTGISFTPLACASDTIIPYYDEYGPIAGVTVSCAVQADSGISVNYSLTGPAGFGAAYTNQVAFLGNDTTLDLSGILLTYPGVYTLTINTITDRIAKKSGLPAIPDGTFNTFVLQPIPSARPVFHVTNQ